MSNIQYYRTKSGKLWYVFIGKFESPMHNYYNRMIISDAKKVWLKRNNMVVITEDESVKEMMYSKDEKNVNMAHCILEAKVKQKEYELIKCM